MILKNTWIGKIVLDLMQMEKHKKTIPNIGLARERHNGKFPRGWASC